MCNSVIFSIFTKLYNHCLYLIPKYFYHPPKNSVHLSSHPPAFHPLPTLHLQPLTTTQLCSMSMELTTLNTSNKWNQTICGLLCLVSFICHNDFKFHICCSMYQYFIPFYDPKKYSTVSLYHMCLFICQLMDFLAIMK